MPCQDGRDFSPIVAQREIDGLQRSVKLAEALHKRELDSYANMLCEQCTHLENLQIPVSQTMTPRVTDWWREHKRIDAIRQERLDREAKEKQAQEEKEAAAVRARETAEYIRLKQKLGL